MAVNAGSFAPLPGRAAQTCKALVEEGNVGQHLGQRGGDFGGVVTADRIELNAFSTNPEKGPPLLVLDIVFEITPAGTGG